MWLDFFPYKSPGYLEFYLQVLHVTKKQITYMPGDLLGNTTWAILQVQYSLHLPNNIMKKYHVRSGDLQYIIGDKPLTEILKKEIRIVRLS